MPYNDYWKNEKNVDDLESAWSQEDPARREPGRTCVRELTEKGVVLDVGCGTLQDYQFFKDQGWIYIGLDPSLQMIAKVHELHPEATVFEGDIVEIKNSPIISVDLVYCSSVICHLPLDFVDTAIENMARITRKHLIIYTPYVFDGPGTTTTEYDPNGYIRNRFELTDLEYRISQFARIKSIHRAWDVCAIRSVV